MGTGNGWKGWDEALDSRVVSGMGLALKRLMEPKTRKRTSHRNNPIISEAVPQPSQARAHRVVGTYSSFMAAKRGEKGLGEPSKTCGLSRPNKQKRPSLTQDEHQATAFLGSPAGRDRRCGSRFGQTLLAAFERFPPLLQLHPWTSENPSQYCRCLSPGGPPKAHPGSRPLLGKEVEQ